MKRPFAVAISFIAGGIATATAQTLPRSPLNPSTEDCRNLNQAYFERKSEIYKQIFVCFRAGDTDIGYTEECGRRVLRAYRRCAPLDTELCEVQEAQEREYAVCMSRVEREQEISADERRMAEGVRTANTYSQQFLGAAQLIKDPVSFVERALGRAVREQIFASRNERLDLAQQVYDYAFLQARTGLAATRSPFIRSFQSAQLEIATAQMDRFVAESRGSGRGETPRPVPLRPLPHPTTKPDECAILRDPDQSRALMMRNTQQWRQLNDRCS